MKFILEPKGWPARIEDASSGLLARVRKGKMLLYFKAEGNIYDTTGTRTTVRGPVQAVELRTEK